MIINSDFLKGCSFLNLDTLFSEGVIRENLPVADQLDFFFSIEYLDILSMLRYTNNEKGYLNNFIKIYKYFAIKILGVSEEDFSLSVSSNSLGLSVIGNTVAEYNISNEKELLSLIKSKPSGVKCDLDTYKDELLYLTRAFRLFFALEDINDTLGEVGVRGNELYLKYKNFSNYDIIKNLCCNENTNSINHGGLSSLYREKYDLLKDIEVSYNKEGEYSKLVIKTDSSHSVNKSLRFNLVMYNLHFLVAFLMNSIYELGLRGTIHLALAEELFSNVIYHNFRNKSFKVIVKDTGLVDFIV